VLRILDGDTFEARVQLWPGLQVTTKVRLRGIDAPEMKAHCAEERARAEAARDLLKMMLADGEVVVARISLDKYGGRVLADAQPAAPPIFRRRCSRRAWFGPMPVAGARLGVSRQARDPSSQKE
jgi:nuclease-like protein